VLAEMETAAVRPIAVTPDQYDAIKAAVKPGTWIVVRDVQAVEVATTADNSPAQAPPTPAVADAQPAPPAPVGPPVRPRDGRCPIRGGLPHGSLRYVYTDAPSVYHPGRLRVDGLCKCGERLIDVGCPHMKTELNQAGQVACRHCRAQLGSQAGAIDNRNLAWGGMSPQGAANPHIALPIPPGSEENAPIDAYRAPGA